MEPPEWTSASILSPALSGWTGPSDPQLSAAEPLVKIISEMSRRYGSDILPVDVAID